MKTDNYLKIGIFGGTFNPPHIGHVKSAMAAAEQLELDRLIIVPAGIPPHKAMPAGSPSAEMRLHMTRTAFEEMHSAIVLDIEIYNTVPNYTVQTVSIIKQDYPNARLYLLTGTDMYLTLDMWKNSEELLKAITPIVFFRSAEDIEKITEYSQNLQNRNGVRTITVKNDVIDISSSQLRDMLPERKGIGYIADTTYAYIIANRLYGAKPDWEWLREQAYSMLNPARIPHVAGCEEEALRLAKRWNVDPDDAREAAILHDITKRLNLEENLRILEEHSVLIGKLELGEEKLLHSKSGAALAKTLFGVSDKVADAISWHTTGRAGMTDLDKIIYLADYIEPMRDFPGVEDLRAAAYADINKAVKIGLELSVQDMRERGITPNKITFEALNDL